MDVFQQADQRLISISDTIYTYHKIFVLWWYNSPNANLYLFQWSKPDTKKMSSIDTILDLEPHIPQPGARKPDRSFH